MKTEILSIFAILLILAVLLAAPLFATEQALGFRLVVPSSTKGAMEKICDDEKLWVEPTAAFGIADINHAFASFTNETWTVTVKLTDDATKRFAEYSGKHVGSRLAILSQGKILSAPVLREAISGGSMAIVGNFTEETARLLVMAVEQRKSR